MANKTLNTRIKHKTDSYENWTSANPVLLSGEIAVVVVPSSSGAVQQEPATLIKIGDGSTAFNDLPFLSALSADVHDWALAAEKPVYSASEITGLDAYISAKVQDTNTKYKIEQDDEDDHKFYLYYQELNGEWTLQDTIIIPDNDTLYTLIEGTSNGTVSFNGEDVKVHGLNSAAYRSEDFFAAADSVYNKSEVDEKIAGAVSSIYKPAGSVAYAELPEPAEQVLGCVYNVTDAFTTDERFVDGAEKEYSSGTNVVVVKSGEEYKFDVLSGVVDLSDYATTEALNQGIQNAKGYADELNSAMDARMQAVETDKHTHLNKTLLDAYTQTEENLADAVAKKHEHVNKEVLDDINSEKVAAWDAKADDSALAVIAKSGDAKDLTQTPGDYIIFDCGSATTVI